MPTHPSAPHASAIQIWDMFVRCSDASLGFEDRWGGGRMGAVGCLLKWRASLLHCTPSAPVLRPLPRRFKRRRHPPTHPPTTAVISSYKTTISCVSLSLSLRCRFAIFCDQLGDFLEGLVQRAVDVLELFFQLDAAEQAVSFLLATFGLMMAMVAPQGRALSWRGCAGVVWLMCCSSLCFGCGCCC